MKTKQLTQQQVEPDLARFGELRPQSSSYADEGIPKEAYEMMTAQTLFLLMAPEKQCGPHGPVARDRHAGQDERHDRRVPTQ